MPCLWASGEGGTSWQEPVAEHTTHFLNQEAEKKEQVRVPLPVLEACSNDPRAFHKVLPSKVLLPSHTAIAVAKPLTNGPLGDVHPNHSRTVAWTPFKCYYFYCRWKFICCSWIPLLLPSSHDFLNFLSVFSSSIYFEFFPRMASWGPSLSTVSTVKYRIIYFLLFL